VISHIYQRAKGKLQIIGVGGIFTAEDAYRKIKNGANAVQLITGFIYGGPMTMKNINLGLLRLLEKDGYKNISEAVGKLETTKI
jgi:dihydroorotate dehydrogenase